MAQITNALRGKLTDKPMTVVALNPEAAVVPLWASGLIEGVEVTVAPICLDVTTNVVGEEALLCVPDKDRSRVKEVEESCRDAGASVGVMGEEVTESPLLFGLVVVPGSGANGYVEGTTVIVLVSPVKASLGMTVTIPVPPESVKTPSPVVQLHGELVLN
jgi:hypothetical protein